MGKLRGEIRKLWIGGVHVARSQEIIYPDTARENLRPLSTEQLEKMLKWEMEAENYEFCAIIRQVLDERTPSDSP